MWRCRDVAIPDEYGKGNEGPCSTSSSTTRPTLTCSLSVRSPNHPAGSSAIGSFKTWWSPDRNTVLVASPDGLSLWDTDTLRLIGDLHPQPGLGLFADFDASGELLATMRYSAEGLDRHVVITDVRTRAPLGQCLLGDSDAMHLASDGRTVLGYQGNRLLFCRRAD